MKKISIILLSILFFSITNVYAQNVAVETNKSIVTYDEVVDEQIITIKGKDTKTCTKTGNICKKTCAKKKNGTCCKGEKSNSSCNKSKESSFNFNKSNNYGGEKSSCSKKAKKGCCKKKINKCSEDCKKPCCVPPPPKENVPTE